jgi:hypothetical protein
VEQREKDKVGRIQLVKKGERNEWPKRDLTQPTRWDILILTGCKRGNIGTDTAAEQLIC